MPNIDVDAVLKALGLFGAALGWLYQVRAKFQRDKIKTDLEILEKSRQLFGESDERAHRVEAKVTLIMGYLYRDDKPKDRNQISWADFALFVVCLVGAAAFGWSGAWSDKYWELAVAGLLAFIGIGALLNALGRNGSTEAAPNPPPAADV
jgi:hypothetical protein